ncbi:MAG TPA: hypothetical protein VGO21_02320 [Candidatus Paceibacterota bacterium]|nr:hypothetical protein [Candidatus Paceibacterota bacterium]
MLQPIAIKNQSRFAKFGINSNFFFLLLFCYQTIVIFQGIDLADTGFYGTFYQQIFNDPQSVTYCFMFWLSGIIGGLFLKILPLAGLLGLRMLWVVVFTITIIVTYRFLKNYVSPGYLQISLFLLTLNLNNDPKEFYYNNFSSLLYVITAILLFKGLRNKQPFALFGSGAIISLNMFNRFPNLLGFGLALAIIYYGYLEKETVKTIVNNILVFLAGFILTMLIVLLIMELLGHLQIYLGALKILAGIGKRPVQVKPNQDFYSISKMIKTIIHHWVVAVIMAALLILSVLSFYFFENKFKKLIPKSDVLFSLLKIIIIAGMTILVAKGVITNLTVLYLITGICLIVGCAMIIFDSDKDINLLLFIGIFILLVHPMGSSEGIETVEIYSFWIAFPIVADRIIAVTSGTTFTFKNLIKPFRISNFIQDNQLTEARKIIVALTIFASLFYTYDYPHSDMENRAAMRYSVNNKYMKGIFTTKERAEEINELLAASSKYVKANDRVLAYDCVPIFHFMTATIPYTRNPWPWLYQSNTFKKELEIAEGKNKQLPVIIMQTALTLGNGKNWPVKKITQDYLKLPINIDRNEILEDFINEHKYHEVWSNDYFKILIPENAVI